MKWNEIGPPQCVGQRRRVGTYEYHLNDLDVWVNAYVFETGEGSYTAFFDGVRLKSGHPEFPTGFGLSIEESLKEGINDFLSLLQCQFPLNIPPWGIVRWEAYQLEEDLEENRSYPYQAFDFFDWRNDKVSFGRRSGPYLEFQLESDGTFTFWNPESLFVGNTVFDPVIDLFTIGLNGFENYGVNLYSLKNMQTIMTRIKEKKRSLKCADSLAQFLQIIGPVSRDVVFGPGDSVWIEFKQAILDLLSEVEALIDKGLMERRCLFILGI